jgi:hypothetical protein
MKEVDPMISGDVTAQISEPDEQGYVWLTVCDATETCASFNLGRPGDPGVNLVLRKAGLVEGPATHLFSEKYLATLH